MAGMCFSGWYRGRPRLVAGRLVKAIPGVLKLRNELTQDEREANRQRMEASRRLREDEDELKLLRCARKGGNLWNKAREQVDESPVYQERESLSACASWGKMLVVPIWDISGPLMSLQFILPDGTKRYLSNGQKECGFVLIGRKGGRGWPAM